MRIRPAEETDGDSLRLEAGELSRLVSQPTDHELRPCGNCDNVCGCPAASRTCCCGCTVDCALAPRMLSADPERYPIEERVVPLVYEMSSLRLAPPCWSCEGHAGHSGELERIPQLWFYCSSLAVLGALAEHLANLWTRKQLGRPWQISALARVDHESPPCFAIRPDIAYDGGSPALHELQVDLQVVGRDLAAEVRRVALRRIHKLNTLAG